MESRYQVTNIEQSTGWVIVKLTLRWSSTTSRALPRGHMNIFKYTHSRNVILRGRVYVAGWRVTPIKADKFTTKLYSPVDQHARPYYRHYTQTIYRAVNHSMFELIIVLVACVRAHDSPSRWFILCTGLYCIPNEDIDE